MPVIHLKTFINTTQEVVFDLSRSVDLHKSSMAKYHEQIIDGISGGLMNKGDTVTWQAKHLFKNRTLKVCITEMQPPLFFADEMVKDDFRTMRHEHHFQQTVGGTLMIDDFYFESPFGYLGKLVNAVFLKRYLTRLLQQRNAEIRRAAESNH